MHPDCFLSISRLEPVDCFIYIQIGFHNIQHWLTVYRRLITRLNIAACYSKAVWREHKNDFGIPLEKPFVKLKWPHKVYQDSRLVLFYTIWDEDKEMSAELIVCPCQLLKNRSWLLLEFALKMDLLCLKSFSFKIEKKSLYRRKLLYYSSLH